jgi:hypothetical protein
VPPLDLHRVIKRGVEETVRSCWRKPRWGARAEDRFEELADGGPGG